MRYGFTTWVEGEALDQFFDLDDANDRNRFLELHKEYQERISATCPDGCPLVLRKAHYRKGAYVEVTLTHKPSREENCPYAKGAVESRLHLKLKALLMTIGQRLAQVPQLEAVEVSDGVSSTMRIDVAWKKAGIAWEVDVTPKSLGRTLVRSGRQEATGYRHSIAVLPRSRKRVFQPKVKAIEVNTQWLNKNRFRAHVRPVYQQRVDPETFEFAWETTSIGIECFSRGLVREQLGWKEISARRRGWCIPLSEEEIAAAKQLRIKRSQQRSLRREASASSRRWQELERQLASVQDQRQRTKREQDVLATDLPKDNSEYGRESFATTASDDPVLAFGAALRELKVLQSDRSRWSLCLLDSLLRALGFVPKTDQALARAYALGEQALSLLDERIVDLQRQIESTSEQERRFLEASEEKEVILAKTCRRLGKFPWTTAATRERY